MGKIDLEALKLKYEQEFLKKGNTRKSSDEFIKTFIQLDEGTTVVRILPPKDDRGFYAESKIHRLPFEKGGVKNYHCLWVNKKKCPICEVYYGLWKEVNNGNKSKEQLARSLKATPRYYLNVVDRRNNEVKILSIGKILMDKIITTMIDPDFGDITDIHEGHDFKIIKRMEKVGSREWPKYDQSGVKPNKSPAGTDKDITVYMESMHDIHGLIKEESYETGLKYADQLRISGFIEDSDTQFNPEELEDKSPATNTEVTDTEAYLKKIKG